MRQLLVAISLASVAAAQGTTWFTNPTNGRQYALTPPLGWVQAEAFAVASGGHLVTIRSAAEQAWLFQVFGSVQRFWSGFTDVAQEGTWVWSSGEPVTYTNWHPGEPNNAGNEDFADMSGPGWNDIEDTILLPGIMEASLPAATFTPFGSGCVGPNALVPSLAGAPGETPQLGATTHIRVTNLPLVVTIPVFVLGLSNTQDPGPPPYALPLDLGIFGWPGCPQLISDDVIDFAITATGQADYGIVVPSNLTLVGFTFHAQVFVLYLPTGVAVSNGLTGVVGY